MNKTQIRKLTITGMLLSIMLLFSILPIGFIPISTFNATLMHIPVLVGLFAEGLGVGCILGFAFGMSSFIKAYVTPTLTSFAFQKPWFSIPPRVIFPIVAWAVALLVIKLALYFTGDKYGDSGKSASLHIGRVVGSFVGTATNTVLVLSAMRFFFLNEYAAIKGFEATEQVGSLVTAAMVTTGMTQGLAEALLAAFLVPLICYALDKAFPKAEGKMV